MTGFDRPMLKSELRQIYLEKRRSLSASEMVALSRDIGQRFFETVDLTAVENFHTFISISKFNEIDTSVIHYKLWRDFASIQTFVPRADLVTGEIESILLDPETELIENKWGIREAKDGRSIDPQEIDLVLVPLLCFDRQGFRVGYGKGMYDRFLNKCRAECVKVGLSYFPPVERIGDLDEYDIPLDLVITPAETYRIPIRSTQ